VNNRKILLVDDVGSMRDVIKAFLHSGGHKQVDVAYDGVHARQQIKSHDYALIICDFEMPKMNGIELLKIIRANSDLRHLQFIMVTSHNKIENIKQAIDAGVNDYIAKPFQPDNLLTKVENTLKNRRNGIEAEQAVDEVIIEDEFIIEIEG